MTELVIKLMTFILLDVSFLFFSIKPYYITNTRTTTSSSTSEISHKNYPPPFFFPLSIICFVCICCYIPYNDSTN